VRVKLLDRDERGRLRLSMKALTPKPEGDAGGGTRDAGSSEPALAAVGAESGGESGEGEESGERSDRSDRGERPRRGRGGRGRNGGGGSGGRARE